MKANKVYRSKERVYIFSDKQLERAAKNNITEDDITNRMFHGWDIDDIVNTPVKRRKKRTVKATKPDITKTRKESKKKQPQKKSTNKIINQKRTYPPVKPSEYYFNLLEFATKHFKAGDDHA